LSIRYGNNWHISKPLEHRTHVRHVEAPMQSCDVRNSQVAADRKMQVPGVKMNKIELINVLDDMIYQKDFPRHGIFAALVLPK